MPSTGKQEVRIRAFRKYIDHHVLRSSYKVTTHSRFFEPHRRILRVDFLRALALSKSTTGNTTIFPSKMRPSARHRQRCVEAISGVWEETRIRMSGLDRERRGVLGYANSTWIKTYQEYGTCQWMSRKNRRVEQTVKNMKERKKLSRNPMDYKYRSKGIYIHNLMY